MMWCECDTPTLHPVTIHIDTMRLIMSVPGLYVMSLQCPLSLGDKVIARTQDYLVVENKTHAVFHHD